MFVNQIKRVPPIAVPIILAVIVVFLPRLASACRISGRSS